MSTADQKKALLLALVLWWLWKREHVTAEIDFPQGNCYDEETNSYYVGDC